MEVFEGRDAIRVGLEEWIGVYDDFEQVLQEFRDLGSWVGFGVFLQRGRLRGSRGFLELRYANVAAWADGRIERMTSYVEIDDGRAAGERLAQERRSAQTLSSEVVTRGPGVVAHAVTHGPPFREVPCSG